MIPAFLCREGMLLGVFTRNQFSYSEGNILTAEKLQTPTLQSAWSQQVAVTLVEGVELSGINVVLRASVAVRSQRTNWKNGHPCSSSSFIDMNRRHVLGLTFVMVQHVLTFLSDWAMYFLAINLLLSIYYSSDLLHLLHHWFEWPPFGGRGSLERDVWIKIINGNVEQKKE